mmetsp:Transcript_34272/g.74957  ORF Transcript_34272/g.74957 Transcript_34272/m.74957 type:complete len:327 (+) Transcript_34272:366-1346(+)
MPSAPLALPLTPLRVLCRNHLPVLAINLVHRLVAPRELLHGGAAEHCGGQPQPVSVLRANHGEGPGLGPLPHKVGEVGELGVLAVVQQLHAPRHLLVHLQVRPRQPVLVPYHLVLELPPTELRHVLQLEVLLELVELRLPPPQHSNARPRPRVQELADDPERPREDHARVDHQGDGVGVGVVLLVDLGQLLEGAQQDVGQRGELDPVGVHDGERLVHRLALHKRRLVHHVVRDVLHVLHVLRDIVVRGDPRGDDLIHLQRPRPVEIHRPPLLVKPPVRAPAKLPDDGILVRAQVGAQDAVRARRLPPLYQISQVRRRLGHGELAPP